MCLILPEQKSLHASHNGRNGYETSNIKLISYVLTEKSDTDSDFFEFVFLNYYLRNTDWQPSRRHPLGKLKQHI